MTDSAQADRRQTLVLVDAHALVYQLYHAVAPMTAADGRPTNIVFGFARDLFFFRDELRPDYLIYIFDAPGPTFRDELVTDYKAHRKPPDDDLVAQIPMITSMLEAAHVPVLAMPGFEADDLIATIAAAGAQRGLDVLICSSDKDCRQLIGDYVRMLNLRKRTFLDRAALFEDWGVTPEQAVDFQTLVGDSVDNVKGVRGVGEKTAAKLLQKFGSLDGLVANVDQLNGLVSPKIQASLKEAIETKALERGRKLVRLETNVPMKLDWEGWHLRDWDAAKLLAIFQDLGFRSFANRMRSLAAPPGEPRQGDLFAGVAPPPPPDADAFPFGANAPGAPDIWQGDYKLIATPEQFKLFLKDLKKQKRFAVDLETTGLDPLTCELVGVAISWKAGWGYYLPVRGPAGEPVLDETELLATLKPLLENPKIAKINQNIKFDENVFRHLGIRLQGVAGDSMVADYLLRSGERSHGLDDLAQRYFQHENIHIEELIGKKGKNQKTMAEVSTALVAKYAGEDADVAWRLCERLEPELDQEGLRSLYDELEVPLIEVLADLEYTGIRLDVPFLAKLSQEMADQLEDIERDIYKLAGRQFNIASPKQLGQVLFEELKLPVQKKTDLTGAASTNQETLEKLAAFGHELPRKIIEHRQISKLKGTYVDALPALVNPQTGRVHTRFNQTVASTGRLSSSDPNLQNIPARSEQGKQIRQSFLPQEGWVLLTADYSQVELRILAHFCGDPTLRQAFAEDRDIHATVAAQIYNVTEDAVTSNQRRVAKTVNFGVLYGMSPAGLAQRLGMPRDEASRFIDAYFARYPTILEYQQKVLNKCRADGYGTTILGRRRKFDKASIRSYSSYQNRNQAEREAINMEIQGSAADLMKRAMLNTYHRLRKEKRAARMLLTVHDELVFEVPPAELPAVSALVRHEMVGAMTLDVPLKVDVAAGPNWLDVQDVAA
ncbi:MAG: DNA polymerase I [Gemmataceae bacterium]